MDGQASLNDCVSIKTLHTEAQVSILGWQHSEGIASVVSGRNKHCLNVATISRFSVLVIICGKQLLVCVCLFVSL